MSTHRLVCGQYSPSRRAIFQPHTAHPTIGLLAPHLRALDAVSINENAKTTAGPTHTKLTRANIAQFARHSGEYEKTIQGLSPQAKVLKRREVTDLLPPSISVCVCVIGRQWV